MMAQSNLGRPSSQAAAHNASGGNSSNGLDLQDTKGDSGGSISSFDSKNRVNQSLGPETDGKAPPCVDITPIDSKQSSRPFMRNWRRVIVAIAVYTVLLVIPWSLTCIMIFRPLNLPAYLRYRNFFRAEDFDFNEKAQVFTNILNTIRAVATLPAIGVVLAQAAVIHTQRRSQSHRVSILSTFALADHGWSDARHLWSMVRTFWRHNSPDQFLVLASAVALLFAIVQPLEQLLVTTSSVKVSTCQNNIACTNITGSELIGSVGYDPWPEGFNQIPLYPVVKDVTASLTAQYGYLGNPYLWSERKEGMRAAGYPGQLRPPQSGYDGRRLRAQPFFVSSLQEGASTGAIRQHAIRLNSSVGCEEVEQFPVTCSGHRPLSASYTATTPSPHDLNIQICAPGDYGNPIFTNSRNRQDVLEELYFKIDVGHHYHRLFWPGSSGSIQMRCSVVTTRGYFEVDNDFVGEQHQRHVLSEWPSMNEINEKFMDVRDPWGGDFRPLLDHDNFTAGSKYDGQVDSWGRRFAHRGFWHVEDGKIGLPLGTPGPLLTTAVALFGPDSFFDILRSHEPTQAFRLLCYTNQVPFYFFTPQSPYNPMRPYGYQIPSCQYPDRKKVDRDNILAGFFQNFLDRQLVEQMLSFSVFEANRAFIFQAAFQTQNNYPDHINRHHDKNFSISTDVKTRMPRAIFASSSHLTHKPSAALASVVLLTILYTMQLVVLLAAARYFHTHPTWASGLDAMTLARLVASMAPEDLKCLATLKDREDGIEALREMDGLVGVKEGCENQGDETEKSDEQVTTASGRELTIKDLALGGPGVITR